MNQQETVAGRQAPPHERRSFVAKMDSLIVPGVALLAAAGLWAPAALLFETGVLANPATQDVFIGLMATYVLPGIAMPIMIFGLAGLFSAIQAAFWPRAALRRRFGRAIGAGAMLLWVGVALVKLAFIAEGVRLWSIGPYTDLNRSMGGGLPDWGLLLASIVAGLGLALAPEGLFGWAVRRAWRVWRG